MRMLARNQPLTDEEFDRLAEFLKRCNGGRAMNVEELDGFFAALVAGPEMVLPSEYLPVVMGSKLSDGHEFSSFEEANSVLALMLRHWNDIAATLSKGQVYSPVLWRTRTASRTAMIGRGASCGAWRCATTAGLS
jgi:uncharacterized protein